MARSETSKIGRIGQAYSLDALTKSGRALTPIAPYLPSSASGHERDLAALIDLGWLSFKSGLSSRELPPPSCRKARFCRSGSQTRDLQRSLKSSRRISFGKNATLAVIRDAMKDKKRVALARIVFASCVTLSPSRPGEGGCYARHSATTTRSGRNQKFLRTYRLRAYRRKWLILRRTFSTARVESSTRPTSRTNSPYANSSRARPPVKSSNGRHRARTGPMS